MTKWRRGFLSRLLFPERHSLVLILIFGVLSAALMLIFPVGVQALVNSIAFTGIAQPLVVLTIIVFILLASATLLQLAQVYLMELVQRRLYVRGIEGLRGFLKANEGAHMRSSRFAEVSVVQKNLTKLWIEGMALVFRLIVGFLLLLLYHPTLAVFGFLMVGGIALTVFLGVRKGRNLAIEESNAKYSLIDHMVKNEGSIDDNLSNDGVLYLAAREAHFNLLFRQTVVIFAIALLSGTIILTIGGGLVLSGQLSIGQLVAAELIIGMISFSLFKFPKHLETYYDLVASLIKLRQVFSDHHGFDRNTRQTFRQFQLHNVKFGKVAFRLTFAAIGIIVFILLLPWRQTTMGTGRVIAYAPEERPQTLEATVDGRVRDWHVREGDWVDKGDLLVRLEDTDPLAIKRLEDERRAVKKQLEAVTLSRGVTNKNFNRQKHLFNQGIVARLQMEKAEVELAKVTQKEAEVSAKLAQVDLKISRQHAQRITAPVSGLVSRVFRGPGGEILKKGDPLLVLVPQAHSRMVEAWIDGNDVPLMESGLPVRIQFEGWPAVLFSGWPGLTVGTFPGIVKGVDPMDDSGRFRVLVKEPEPNAWPPASILRQGTRSMSWVLMQQVTIGFEFWRRMNGFPVLRDPKAQMNPPKQDESRMPTSLIKKKGK